MNCFTGVTLLTVRSVSKHVNILLVTYCQHCAVAIFFLFQSVQFELMCDLSVRDLILIGYHYDSDDRKHTTTSTCRTQFHKHFDKNMAVWSEEMGDNQERPVL